MHYSSFNFSFHLLGWGKWDGPVEFSAGLEHLHSSFNFSFHLLGRGKWDGPVEFSAGLEHLHYSSFNFSFHLLGWGKWDGPVEFSAGLEHLHSSFNINFSFTCRAGANGMDRLNFRLDWNICIVVLILIFLSLAGLGQMGWTG